MRIAIIMPEGKVEMTNIDSKSLEEQHAALSSPKPLSLLHSIKNHKKKVIALLGTAVILIGVTVNHLDVLNLRLDIKITKIQQPTEKQQPAEKTSSHIRDLKFLAGTLLDTKNWAAQPVHSFNEQWNILKLDEKNSTKQFAWFQKFSTGLKNQITHQGVLIDSGDQQAIRRKTELIVLAGSLGLSIVSTESINQDDKTPSPVAQMTPKEPQPPLAQATPKEPQPPLAQATPKEPQPPLAQATPKEPQPPLVQATPQEPQPPLAQATPKEPQPPLVQATPQEPQPPLVQATPKDQDIIKRTAAKTLNTSPRDVIKKSNHQLNAANAKLAYPSRAELQNLVSRYVKTYQEGDVKGLVSLFTKKKSSTSKQVSQQELMEYNYSELFESTAERRISITNLKWSYKDNKAIGKGNLTLQYDDEVDVNIAQKGKVLIVAERNQARVGLKNLFHIIDQN